MRIRYRVDIGDVAAFWEHSFVRSCRDLVHRADVFVLVFALMIGGPLGIWLLLNDGAELVIAIVSMGIAMVLTSLLYWFLLRPHVNRVLPRLIARCSASAFAGMNLKGALGQQELTCTDEGLEAVSETAEAKYFWHGIESVQQTDTHAFIYLNSITAIVVPRDSVTEGNFDTFVAEVTKIAAPEQ